MKYVTALFRCKTFFCIVTIVYHFAYAQETGVLDSSAFCTSGHRYAIPVFFGPRSFCDPDVEALSMLDCREDLMKIYRKQVKAAERGGRSSLVDDPKLWDKVVSLKSIFFNSCLEYYALFAQDSCNPVWQPVDIKLRLKFTAEEYCDGPSVMVNLSFENPDSSIQPILYAGLPRPKTGENHCKPTGFFRPRLLSQTHHKLTATEKDPADNETISTFEAPPGEPRINQVLRCDGKGYVQYEGKTLTVWSRLKIVMKSGDTIGILEDKMFGHHSLNNAFIGNPFFTDINGDGLFDIVVESSGKSQVLILQLPYGGLEYRYLRNRDMTGSGGC